MATSTLAPNYWIVVELGKLHPDYSIIIETRPVDRQYPTMTVFNEDKIVGIEIRLAEMYWDITTLDRLVVKAIKSIEKEKKS